MKIYKQINRIVYFIYRYYIENIKDFFVYAICSIFLFSFIAELLYSTGDDYQEILIERLIFIFGFFLKALLVYMLFKIFIVEIEEVIIKLKKKRKK